MNMKNWIAGLAIVTLGTAASAQTCAGHAQAKGGGEGDVMAMVTKELSLSDAQQAAFSKALDACHKDCASMDDKAGADMSGKKQARFDEAVASMKDQLKPEQFAKLQEMHKEGKLAQLCASGSKGCCAGKASAGKSCCAGKAHAEAAPAAGREKMDASGAPAAK